MATDFDTALEEYVVPLVLPLILDREASAAAKKLIGERVMAHGKLKEDAQGELVFNATRIVRIDTLESFTRIRKEALKGLGEELEGAAPDQASTGTTAGGNEEPMVDDLRREMRSEIASLRSEMTDQRKELNGEITRTRTEILEVLRAIQSDFNAFRSEVRTDLDRLKESDTSRRVEISDLRGDLRTYDSQLRTEISTLRGEVRNELTDMRGDLKALNARLTTATAVIVGVVTLMGSIVGILGALGVFT